MDYSLLIAYLRQKQYITDLEKDILDTWNELQKTPFDYRSAQMQVMKNDAKHPEILAAIKALPTTVIRPFDQVTENDIRYNLGEQLEALAMKEGWPTNSNDCYEANANYYVPHIRLYLLFYSIKEVVSFARLHRQGLCLRMKFLS